MPRRRDDDDDYTKDDDDYEAPRSRRRAADEDEDETPRRPRAKRARDDDDDDEDESPRRTRRSRAAADDDDEDERPAPKRRRAARDDDEDEDEAPKPKKRRPRDDDDDEDDEDEAPKARRKRSRDDDDDEEERPAKNLSSKFGGGWKRAKSLKEDSGTYAQSLKLTGEDQIVRFLETDPYASWKQHWIEREGKKSFTCLADLDAKGCPLCAIGDKPRALFAFNVAVWDGTDWKVKSLEVGVTVLEQIGNYHEDKRTGPITKMYWAVKRTGKGRKSTTNFAPIKEADLEEDWDTDPISSKQMRSMESKLYTPEVIEVPTRRALMDIRAELDS